MANHLFTVPCLRVIRDQKTNLFSLVDIVESVLIETTNKDDNTILQMPPIRFYSKWGRTTKTDQKEEFEIKIKATHEDNENIEISKFDAHIPEDSLGVVLDLEIAGLKIPKAGIWNFIIEWKKPKAKNWQHATKLPIFTKERATKKP